MSLRIKNDGFQPCPVPPEVEAEGPEAIDAYVAENQVAEAQPDPAPAVEAEDSPAPSQE